MPVQIKTNKALWKSITDAAADFASAALAEQMMGDSSDYIPKSAGDDRREGGSLSDIGKIEKTAEGERALVWDNVYAGYQWFGARADGTHEVENYTTPGTGKAWVDEAEAAHGDDWQKVAQNAFTEALK